MDGWMDGLLKQKHLISPYLSLRLMGNPSPVGGSDVPKVCLPFKRRWTTERPKNYVLSLPLNAPLSPSTCPPFSSPSSVLVPLLCVLLCRIHKKAGERLFSLPFLPSFLFSFTLSLIASHPLSVYPSFFLPPHPPPLVSPPLIPLILLLSFLLSSLLSLFSLVFCLHLPSLSSSVCPPVSSPFSPFVTRCSPCSCSVLLPHFLSLLYFTSSCVSFYISFLCPSLWAGSCSCPRLLLLNSVSLGMSLWDKLKRKDHCCSVSMTTAGPAVFCQTG